MRIISIDPGKVSGVFSIISNDQDFSEREIDAQELKPMQVGEYVEELLVGSTDHTRCVVVCESYTVNSNTVRHARQYDALEIIGICRYLAHSHGAEFHMQPPGSRLIIGKEHLEPMGWYFPSKDDHMYDAARHITVWLMKNKIIEAQDVFSGQG